MALTLGNLLTDSVSMEVNEVNRKAGLLGERRASGRGGLSCHVSALFEMVGGKISA